MSISTIVKKARALDTRLRATVVECAKDIANEVWTTFGDALTKDNALEIAAGITDATKGPRNSEWVAFAMSVQFGMCEALSYIEKKGGITRVGMFKLARMLVKEGDFTKHKNVADAFLKNKPSRKGAGNATPRTFESAIKSLFAVKTRKANEKKFRAALIVLAAQHKIDIDLS